MGRICHYLLNKGMDKSKSALKTCFMLPYILGFEDSKHMLPDRLWRLRPKAASVAAAAVAVEFRLKLFFYRVYVLALFKEF